MKKLTQPEAATCLGMPFRTYQNYEGDVRPPKTDAWSCFVRAGINANWLLTGEGPMLIADLAPKPIESAPVPPAPTINIDALVQAFCVSLQTAPPGETQAQSARKAVEFYLFCLEKGLITPEGEGSGNLQSAA